MKLIVVSTLLMAVAVYGKSILPQDLEALVNEQTNKTVQSSGSTSRKRSSSSIVRNFGDTEFNLGGNGRSNGNLEAVIPSGLSVTDPDFSQIMDGQIRGTDAITPDPFPIPFKLLQRGLSVNTGSDVVGSITNRGQKSGQRSRSVGIVSPNARSGRRQRTISTGNVHSAIARPIASMDIGTAGGENRRNRGRSALATESFGMGSSERSASAGTAAAPSSRRDAIRGRVNSDDTSGSTKIDATSSDSGDVHQHGRGHGYHSHVQLPGGGSTITYSVQSRCPHAHGVMSSSSTISSLDSSTDSGNAPTFDTDSFDTVNPSSRRGGSQRRRRGSSSSWDSSTASVNAPTLDTGSISIVDPSSRNDGSRSRQRSSSSSWDSSTTFGDPTSKTSEFLSEPLEF